MKNIVFISTGKLMNKIILIIFLSAYSIQGFTSNSEFNPHEFSANTEKNDDACLLCHKAQPKKIIGFTGQYILPKMGDYVKGPTNMCTGCHDAENASHIVGVTPEYKVPADLPLNYQKKIACLTCHYAHGKLTSDKPMASSSFMDALFNRERLNKSYILRRNNASGDLCLVCHTE